MILKKSHIEHVLRAAVEITKCKEFVIIGSGALIATAKNLPATLMSTDEVDIYVVDTNNPEEMQELIEAHLGSDSQFAKTYKYHADAVGMETAIMPMDWSDRAIKLNLLIDPTIKISTPCSDDLALSKLCAWREKDVAWLKECVRLRLIDTAAMRNHAAKIESKIAPPLEEILRRITVIESGRSDPSKLQNEVSSK
jgi:hypothetical protein